VLAGEPEGRSPFWAVGGAASARRMGLRRELAANQPKIAPSDRRCGSQECSGFQGVVSVRGAKARKARFVRAFLRKVMPDSRGSPRTRAARALTIAGIARCPFTRRNLLSPRSTPAARQRRRMSHVAVPPPRHTGRHPSFYAQRTFDRIGRRQGPPQRPTDGRTACLSDQAGAGNGFPSAG
jgi:hypothetical protein